MYFLLNVRIFCTISIELADVCVSKACRRNPTSVFRMRMEQNVINMLIAIDILYSIHTVWTRLTHHPHIHRTSLFQPARSCLCFDFALTSPQIGTRNSCVYVCAAWESVHFITIYDRNFMEFVSVVLWRLT